jgi:nucleotide-binding universal stress UspA family protein
MRPVLCAVAPGTTSEHAVREADRIARRVGAPLVALYVLDNPETGAYLTLPALDPSPTERTALFALPAARIAAEVTRLCGRPSGAFTVEVREGDVAVSIARAARELNAALVVLGAGATSARRKDTSIATAVARQSPTPVLVARAPRAGGVLAAVDVGNDMTAAILGVSRQEAAARGRPLLVLHSLGVPFALPSASAASANVFGGGLAPEPVSVGRRDDALVARREAVYRQLRGQLDPLAPDAEVLLPVGAPAEKVAEAATERDADLVVIGGQRRSTLGRWLLGSIAEAVIRRAPCSVLVVKTSV